jgi:CheY-like chemotaxis protein
VFELLGIAGITASMLADLPQLIHLGREHMPGPDGLQLADALPNDEQTRAIPLRFLSTEAARANAERACALGALAYLTKPFDPCALASCVKRALPATRAASAGLTLTVAS